MRAKYQLLKWNQTKICREFGMDSRTVGKKLHAADLSTKKSLNTKQVFAAMLGDLASERIRLTREQADKTALENQQSRGELVPVGKAVEYMGKFLSSARAHVDGDPMLSRDDKDKIIETLGRCLDLACGISPRPAGDTDAAAKDDSEPVGGTVSVSEP